MNEIFSKILYEGEKGHSLMLVTVAAQRGSSPRGRGAQMLVSETGRLLGSVGGGAVELHCEQQAQKLLSEKRSGSKTFLLRKNDQEDIGMVCGGDVTVWFQYIDSSSTLWMELAKMLISNIKNGKGGWLILRKDSSEPALSDQEGRAAVGCLACVDTVPAAGTYRQTQQELWIPLPVGERAILFGGGHCAQALTPLLSTVGFRVTVMDNRPEYADSRLFPSADTVICGDFAKIYRYLQITASDYVVVMTNGHAYDLDIQVQLLQEMPAYVGVIGSRSKKAYVNQKLLEAGIPQENIDRVHSPIGTDIKAVTPEEIAVSIAGEMIYERACIRERTGTVSDGCPMHSADA